MDDSTRIRLLQSYYRTTLAYYTSSEFREQFSEMITGPISDRFIFEVLGPDDLQIVTQKVVLRGAAVVMPLNDAHKDSYLHDFLISSQNCDLDGVSEKGLSQIIEQTLKSSLQKKEVKDAYFKDKNFIEVVERWSQDSSFGRYGAMFA